MFLLRRLLRPRTLVLGNVILGGIFVLAVVSAVIPLMARPGGIAWVRDTGGGSRTGAGEPVRIAMLDDYARVITLNDVFVAKALRRGPPPPPPEDPKWELVGTWSAEDETWQAIIRDARRPARGGELAARAGSRFRQSDCVVVVTEITRDFVRFEMHSPQHERPFKRILTSTGIGVDGPEPDAGR